MKLHNNIRIFIYGVLSVILIISGIVLSNLNKYKNPQEDYASYLIETNNQFVRYMYDFTNLLEEIDDSETRDDDLAKMSSIVVEQNELVKKLKELTPNEDNSDYSDLSDSIFQLYLFDIQGEIYLLEQAYNPNVEERSQTYIGMGNALTNTMGDVILQLPDYINSVRSTNYKADYEYVPADVNDPNSNLTGQIETTLDEFANKTTNVNLFEQNLNNQIGEILENQEG